MLQTRFEDCIKACQECEIICNQCAIACLGEKDVGHLASCIRLNLECATICATAARVMSLDGRFSKDLCELCVAICLACAEECEKHVAMGMEHCRECAEACRKCAKACEQMLA